MTTQRTALLSAFDKTGLDVFAQQLVDLGWNLLASSGTAAYLTGLRIPVRDVAEIVGPPILGHRVVTLSRELHAALLATDSPEDQAELDQLGVPRIDLVYVNLYPLREEIDKPTRTLESVLEKTDIGGPTMLRSAAKGRRIVLCRAYEFPVALDLVRGKFTNNPETERKIISGLASVVEAEISRYCLASAEFHGKFAGGEYINELTECRGNVL